MFPSAFLPLLGEDRGEGDIETMGKSSQIETPADIGRRAATG